MKTLCRYRDGPTISLGSSSSDNDETPPTSVAMTLEASHVEACLSQRLLTKEASDHNSDDEEEELLVVEFPTRYDAHWLKCRPPLRRKSGQSRLSVPTILGADERYDNIEEGHEQEEIPKLCITSYQAQIATSVSPSTCSCIAPHSDWKRRDLTHKEESVDEQDRSVLNVSWVDLRSVYHPNDDIVHTQAGVFHLLRSILGSGHEATPWNPLSTTTPRHPSSHQPQMVVLVVHEPSSLLCDFRISDAAPSWYCHSIAHFQQLESNLNWTVTTTTPLPENTGASPASILVYKPLPPRAWLTTRHPIDDTAPTHSGCLWEAHFPKVNDNKDSRGDGEEQKTEAIPKQKREVMYRPVAPPYCNFMDEYPGCEELFHPTTLQIFREEAVRIPQWTPWPETQHYSTQSVDGSNAKPWTVFPLCHCFPADNLDQFQWIELTKAHCPRTCDLLSKILGRHLRTALFSQLSPNSRLEPVRVFPFQLRLIL